MFAGVLTLRRVWTINPLLQALNSKFNIGSCRRLRALCRRVCTAAAGCWPGSPCPPPRHCLTYWSCHPFRGWQISAENKLQAILLRMKQRRPGISLSLRWARLSSTFPFPAPPFLRPTRLLLLGPPSSPHFPTVVLHPLPPLSRSPSLAISARP